MFTWERTNFDEFPKIYTRFKALDKESDNLVEYRIQDLPEDRFEDALNFVLQDHFMREEALIKGLEMKDSSEAMVELIAMFKIVMDQKLSLICFKDGSDEIVALNVHYVRDNVIKESGLGSIDLKSDVMKKFFAIGRFIRKKSAPNEPQDRYILKGFGLSVNPYYRKRGIATKMLVARIPFMKHIGLRTTITNFSGIGSQTAAIRAEYTLYAEITYKELEENGHHLKHLTEKSAKTLGYQIT